jgi:hypothetical protein
MESIRRHTDPWSAVVIVVTLVLFGLALFLKGLTHDLLIEAGVFLVSVKLIIMGYKQAIASERLHEELDDVRASLARLEASAARTGGAAETIPPLSTPAH